MGRLTILLLGCIFLFSAHVYLAIFHFCFASAASPGLCETQRKDLDLGYTLLQIPDFPSRQIPPYYPAGACFRGPGIPEMLHSYVEALITVIVWPQAKNVYCLSEEPV